MNHAFADLFRYVQRHPLMAQLIAQEERINRNLSDLAFCAEYDQHAHPGTGTLSAYRLSQGGLCAEVNASTDNLQCKLWFVEDSDWRIDHHNPGCKLERFYAAFAYHPDYRPALRVDLNRPILRVTVNDLPTLLRYPQRYVEQEQLVLCA